MVNRYTNVQKTWMEVDSCKWVDVFDDASKDSK